MRIELKNVYFCEHCKKNGLVKWMMEKHEKYCTLDPNNFSKCSNCIHVEETFKEFYHEEYTKSSAAFNCKVKGCGLIPLKARRKGLPEKYPDTFKDHIEMPSECDQFCQKDFI